MPDSNARFIAPKDLFALREFAKDGMAPIRCDRFHSGSPELPPASTTRSLRILCWPGKPASSRLLMDGLIGVGPVVSGHLGIIRKSSCAEQQPGSVTLPRFWCAETGYAAVLAPGVGKSIVPKFRFPAISARAGSLGNAHESCGNFCSEDRWRGRRAAPLSLRGVARARRVIRA